MAALPPFPDSNGDSGVVPDRESVTGIPRWVKIFWFIAIGLFLLVVILMFVYGGSDHGPGRHTASGIPGSETQASGWAGGPAAQPGWPARSRLPP